MYASHCVYRFVSEVGEGGPDYRPLAQCEINICVVYSCLEEYCLLCYGEVSFGNFYKKRGSKVTSMTGDESQLSCTASQNLDGLAYLADNFFALHLQCQWEI